MTSTKVRQRQSGKLSSDPKEKQVKKTLSEDEAVKKASKGWIKAFLLALVVTIVICVSFVILIPSPVQPVDVEELPEPPLMVGPLEQNNVLSFAEKIYRGQVSGPESIVVDGDHIYTGTADGWINHIHKGVVERIVRLGKEPCGGYENENTCGRPLGMRMDKDGFLVVADAYHGLFRVNVVTGDYVMLVSPNTSVNGRKIIFFNDLDIGPDEKIYFSHSSGKWQRNQLHMILWEGLADGRLLVYDPATQVTSQLMDGLFFANGVQQTKDKSAVLIAETFGARIMRYDLKTKQATIWADNLPGTPDNIRYSKVSGTYWVGLGNIRPGGRFSLIDFILPRTWLRGLLAKVLDVKGLLTLRNYFASTDPKAMAIELDENGSIIQSIQDRTGQVIADVSEVESVDGILYFGSFHADYIGRLYRKRIPSQ